MNRIAILLLSLLTAHAFSGEPATSRKDVVGVTLNRWVEDGTAAGFSALNYENRDGGHSLLPADFYHGLKFLRPSQEDVTKGRDKGAAFEVRSEPVIGNCSMAGTAEAFGSIGRALMLTDQVFLFGQYVKNNLIVYPEHEDHDPGANGVGGGWGDMFPANSVTVLASQGSSYHDMPFVKALLSTAASFKPEVQSFLIRQRVLIPTLQSIFRHSNKQVKSEEDYFTGRAHPPVFEESQIDELKMMTLAHTMTVNTAPPIALVQVLSERSVAAGADYFEAARVKGEELGTTPVNVSRVFRSSAEEYMMVVSAGRSQDSQKRPLRFRWEILQGSKDLIKIETKDGGKEATLRIRWHPAFTSAAGIRTHRVDIGLFAVNEISASAPAIVSFYMLPNERRFFDKQGKLTEICYEAGNPELGLPSEDADPRWLSFIETAGVVDDTLLFRSLSDGLGSEQREPFAKAWLELGPRKSEPKESLGSAIAAVLKKRALRPSAEAAVEHVANDPKFFLSNQKDIMALAAQSPRADALRNLQAELRRLTDWQVLVNEEGVWKCVHSPDKLTDADRYYLRQLHLTVLSEVLFPQFLVRSPAPLFVDPRLTARKAWRDVYSYDESGKRNGWNRFLSSKSYRFDATGHELDGDKSPGTAVYLEEAGRLHFDVVRSKN